MADYPDGPKALGWKDPEPGQDFATFRYLDHEGRRCLQWVPNHPQVRSVVEAMAASIEAARSPEAILSFEEREELMEHRFEAKRRRQEAKLEAQDKARRQKMLEWVLWAFVPICFAAGLKNSNWPLVAVSTACMVVGLWRAAQSGRARK